jgi:hypothetical protein
VLTALVIVQHNEDLWSAYELLGSVLPTCTRSVRKVSSHFECLVNRSCGLHVTWQPVRGDLTAHPWKATLLCNGHTVHKLSQWCFTANWLAPPESDCSWMYSKVSDWLLSYIKAMWQVLEIFKMAGYFPDSPRMSNSRAFCVTEIRKWFGYATTGSPLCVRYNISRHTRICELTL